ncbi:MAG: cation:proton antiporter subunit C [Candidatus Limivicinus sp.]|jgi:multicomponent Na+:H+ antiporter subunit C
MHLDELLQRLLENRFETVSVLLFVIGLAGMLFNRNLFKKVVSMGFMDSAIFLFLTSTGYVEGHLAPIITDPSVPATMEVYSSPLPAGLVLTGIVVSVSFTAFSLALTQRLYKKYHSLNIDEIMMQAQKSED